MSLDSIKRVNRAEEDAKALLEHSEAEKGRRISEAERKAALILAAADKEAKEIREKELSATTGEIEARKRSGQAEIKSLSSRIAKMKLSRARLESISKKLAGSLLSGP